jgi:putative transposase
MVVPVLHHGIVKTVGQLDRYPWSGHRSIIGKAKYPWMDTETVLSRFGSAPRQAFRNYRKFVREGMGQGRLVELSGGGLIRSQGGWSQVLAMRRRGRKEDDDERILGSGDFVDRILKEAEDRHLRQLKARRAGEAIEKIMEEACRKQGISLQELKGGGKRRKVSDLRASIALRSRDELGLTAAEIARNVGVSTSAVTRAIERVGKRRDHGCNK